MAKRTSSGDRIEASDEVLTVAPRAPFPPPPDFFAFQSFYFLFYFPNPYSVTGWDGMAYSPWHR